MKRNKFVKELTKAGCYLVRHGANHDIFFNPKTGKKAPVPRHSEIKNSLCDLIRKQLGVKLRFVRFPFSHAEDAETLRRERRKIFYYSKFFRHNE